MKLLYFSSPSAFRDFRKTNLSSADATAIHLSELAKDHLPLTTVDIVVIEGENPAAPVNGFA